MKSGQCGRIFPSVLLSPRLLISWPTFWFTVLFFWGGWGWVFQWHVPNNSVIEHFEHNFFQTEDLNAYFSQIKYFQVLQLDERRELLFMYPQTWLADWDLSTGNLEKQVNISEVRFGSFRNAPEGN